MNTILSIIGDTMLSLRDGFQEPQGHNAEFGHESEIASRFNKGFVISRHRKLTRKKSFENVLLCGPTGSGKTTRLLLKNLYELKNCSIVVNDPSKELYELSSGYLQKKFKIKTLNFSDNTASSGYNILSRIKKPNDINKVAHLLVLASLVSESGGDPFWILQSKTMLSIFIRLIMYQEEQYRNMANVLHALKCFAVKPKTVDLWIARTGDEKLLLDFMAMIAIPEKTRDNILASAKAAIQIFEDPEIAAVTAYDSIDFEQLRREPTVLFLHNNIADQKYCSILNSIFFEQLYGYVLEKRPAEKELDMFIILEEASSLHIPVLPVAIANTRKHRVGNLICVQSPGYLKTQYKDDAVNITGNCITKLFLPGITSMETLQEIETLGGKCTYKNYKDVEQIKQLISIDEIRMLPDDRTLILSGNNPIIKGRTSPFYESFRYERYSKIPAVPLLGDIPNKPVALLNQTLRNEDQE